MRGMYHISKPAEFISRCTTKSVRTLCKIPPLDYVAFELSLASLKEQCQKDRMYQGTCQEIYQQHGLCTC